MRSPDFYLSGDHNILPFGPTVFELQKKPKRINYHYMDMFDPWKTLSPPPDPCTVEITIATSSDTHTSYHRDSLL